MENDNPTCPKCNKAMKNLGNISGLTYTSNPPQWDEVYICETDQTKSTIRKHGSLPPDYSYVGTYKEIAHE